MTGNYLREDAAGRTADLDDSVCLDERDFSRGPECDVSHSVECNVRRRLLSQRRLRFSSLVVRRIEKGVCLEGVVETDTDTATVDHLAAAIDGVDRVLNRLVVRRPDVTPAPKG